MPSQSRDKLEDYLRKLLQEKDEKERVLDRQEATLNQFLSKINNQRQQLHNKQDEIEALLEQNELLERELASKSAEIGDFSTEGPQFSSANIGNLHHQLNTLELNVSKKKSNREELQQILADEQKARQDFIAAAFAAVTDLETKIQDALEKEARMESASPINPKSSIRTLREIQDDRESQIKKIHEEYGRIIEIMRDKEEELAKTQEQTKKDIPIILAKREDEIIQIKEKWTREKKVYLKKFDKLFAINKEQKFHIHRGTYIKPEKKTAPSMTDQKLNDDNADLLSALKELQKRVEEAKEENKDLNKQHTVMLQQHDLMQREFGDAKKQRAKEIEEERRAVHDLQKTNRDVEATITSLKKRGLKGVATGDFSRDENNPVHVRTQPMSAADKNYLKKRGGLGGGSHPREQAARKAGNRFLSQTTQQGKW